MMACHGANATFDSSFHQIHKTMQSYFISFLFVFQSILACKPVKENAQPQANNIAFQTIAAVEKNIEKAEPAPGQILFQSSDGGLTWQDFGTELPKNMEVMSTLEHNGEVYLGSNQGLFRRSNLAVAPVWEKETLPETRVENIFAGKEGLYVSNYEHSFYLYYKSFLTGQWQAIHKGLPDSRILSVVETPQGNLLVAGEFGIYKSPDNGTTWKYVYQGEWIHHIVEMDGILIACCDKGLLQSSDGGENWKLQHTDSGSAFYATVINHQFVARVSGAEGNWSDITGDAASNSNRIRTSVDGISWERMELRLTQMQFPTDILQMGAYIFCSNEEGVFRMASNSEHWELVLPTNAQHQPYRLSLSGDAILATVGWGC
jgi:hypothetical protein